MRNKHPLMKLSPEEELFLRRWMHDEVHFREGPGPAKQLQVQNGAIPADLAVLIAAAIPNPELQLQYSEGPFPASPPRWPWSDAHILAERIAEARNILAKSKK
jgi:hypothetical protein